MNHTATEQHAMENAILEAVDVARHLGSTSGSVTAWLPWALKQLPPGAPAATIQPGRFPWLDAMGRILAARAEAKDGMRPSEFTPAELSAVDPLSVEIHTETIYHLLRMAVLARQSSSLLQDLETLENMETFTFENFID